MNKVPALADELRKRASELVAENQKPERVKLAQLLARKRVVFGMADTEDADWADIWDAYLEALADVPLTAVEVAFQRWNKADLYPKEPGRHAFYPKPAELYALAKDYMTDLQVAAYRAKKFLENAAPPESPRQWTDEERAANIARMKEEGILAGPRGHQIPSFEQNMEKFAVPPPPEEEIEESF